ncbi:hypothetical protein HDU89_005854 [Geranomyces variabilis]|nr:hypothetical protein HDU89_005854 [Geranomyces variabilis]
MPKALAPPAAVHATVAAPTRAISPPPSYGTVSSTSPVSGGLSRRDSEDSSNDGEDEDDDKDESVEVEDEAAGHPLHEPTGSLASSCINISNTILGSGMLAMPSALAGIGLGFGMILIGLSGFAASFGLLLLTEVAAKVGRGSSFNACSKITYPGAAVLFDLAIAVKCFGVSVSYLVICGDLLPRVVAGFFPSIPADSVLLTKTLWVFLSLALVAPLCFLRRLDSLRYTSAFALTAVVYLVFIVVSEFLAGQTPDMPQRPKFSEIRWFKLDDHFFSYLPIFVFAFTCHQNIFSVYNELVDNTHKRVKRVVYTSVGTAFTVYEIVAVLGYLTFGNSVASNIIGQYPASPLITGGQLAIAFLVLLSYPLQCHPCRASVDKIMAAARPYFATRRVISSSSPPSSSPPSPAGERSDWNEERGNTTSGAAALSAKHGVIPLGRWVTITVCIMSASLLLAAVMHDLGTVLAFVGATGSTTICYILPGLFYYKFSATECERLSQERLLLPDGNGGNGRDEESPAAYSRWPVKRVGAVGLTVFGAFVMVTSLASLAMGKGGGGHGA